MTIRHVKTLRDLSSEELSGSWCRAAGKKLRASPPTRTARRQERSSSSRRAPAYAHPSRWACRAGGRPSAERQTSSGRARASKSRAVLAFLTRSSTAPGTSDPEARTARDRAVIKTGCAPAPPTQILRLATVKRARHLEGVRSAGSATATNVAHAGSRPPHPRFERCSRSEATRRPQILICLAQPSRANTVVRRRRGRRRPTGPTASGENGQRASPVRAISRCSATIRSPRPA